MLLNAVAMTVIIRYPDQDDSGGESRPDEKNVLRSNFAARNVSVDGMSASSWTASWDSFQLLLLPRRTEFRIRFNHLSIGRLVTLPEQQLLLVRVLFFFPNRNKFSSAAASWSEQLFNHLEISSRTVNCRWRRKILETWNYAAVFNVPEDNTCQRWIQYDCRLRLGSAWPVTDIRQPIDPNKSAMTTNGIWVNNSNGWKVSGRISLIRVQRFRCFFL